MASSSRQTRERRGMEKAKKHIEKHGMTGIEKVLKAELDRWKDVVINIAITSVAGVGKSSFINAIRGLKNSDEGAAPTGVTQTTTEVADYLHPTNKNIKFWDLPGIGTPDYPAETYSEKVCLKKYDTFLILVAGRFTENDLLLADKVKSMGKSFFFVRTKIDQDARNESRQNAIFNEEEMLNVIREDCLKNLESFGAGDEVVFLISNHYPAKWDFARLTQAILDVLPEHQKESLALSLDLLTSHSKDILKRKVEILRDRIWKVAAASAAVAAIPLPGLSIAVDFVVLIEVNFFKSQLGLPKETSKEFLKTTKENQQTILKFCFKTMPELVKSVERHAADSQDKRYATSTEVEELAQFNPFIGCVIAGGISFSSTYYFLHQSLNELEKTAFDLLDETKTKVVKDMDFD